MPALTFMKPALIDDPKNPTTLVVGVRQNQEGIVWKNIFRPRVWYGGIMWSCQG